MKVRNSNYGFEEALAVGRGPGVGDRAQIGAFSEARAVRTL